MLRVLVGSWMVRYPLGGNLSWTLQWLLGFRRLGHDVYLVEKSGYPDSCFDPVRGAMGDDCSHGAAAVDALLTRHGLEGRWCYVDAAGGYHGLPRGQPPTACRYVVSGSLSLPAQGCFSPVPHGTRPLSVTRE